MIYHPKECTLTLLCCSCGREWEAEFWIEHGCPVAKDSSGEECPECGEEESEVVR